MVAEVLASWEFKMPLSVPISMNDRKHWRVKAEEVANVRRMAFVLAKQHKVTKGMKRITVQLTYHPSTNRRRDAENLVATQKPFIDGLVDARVIPDDTEEFFEPKMPRIGERALNGLAYFVVRIEQLA